jgi:hypothetical protein
MNFSVCKATDLKMNLAERISVALTRTAYILGSMDNITAIVLINSSDVQKFYDKVDEIEVENNENIENV